MSGRPAAGSPVDLERYVPRRAVSEVGSAIAAMEVDGEPGLDRALAIVTAFCGSGSSTFEHPTDRHGRTTVGYAVEALLELETLEHRP